MTLAWFRATPLEQAGPLDETAAAIAVLRSAHAIRTVTALEADEFVWQNHHEPVSLCVFELSGEPVGSTAAELAAQLKAEIAKWQPVIEKVGLKGSQ